MRTLLIDNHDSFTYNLFQLLAETNGVEPVVVRNDEVGWDELSRWDFDNVVISPGPGRPERERDFGVCAELIRRCEAPLLGVCLGHQGLGWVNGGEVEAAPRPMHGRVDVVRHDGSPLFEGLPKRFRAVRYHSLRLATPLPDTVEPIAWSEEGVAMAIAHRRRPQWGVQFHPESVATEYGRRLLENFRALTLGSRTGSTRGAPDRPLPGAFLGSRSTKAPRKAPRAVPQAPGLELRTRRIDGAIDSEAAFVALYADSADAFWLDSSRPGPRARFSFLGDASGPLGAAIAYDVEAHEVTVTRHGSTEVVSESIFDFLEAELGRLRPLAAELPFDFDCGFAGYFGYELKAECGGEAAHRSALPDAAFVFADRMVVIDHGEGITHLLCLTAPGAEAEADAWLERTAASLSSLEPSAADLSGNAHKDPGSDVDLGELGLARSRERYLDDVGECMSSLGEGESYEICLTNSLSTAVESEPLDVYRRLRRLNPAPFSAFLRFGGLALLSSSPERFLGIDPHGAVEARPIKGTSRRGETQDEDALLLARLRDDEKSHAENLMIADLLRNDLGSVCEPGSVEATALMEVETYETVHHLVSAVEGRLRAGLGAADCIRACFPPGSMTGAPKRRTMEILDRLEGRARGPYSGAIGYLGLSGGCDLSVAIRTIVLAGGEATIGAGGAIVVQSDPEAEYEEMLLKAAAPLRAIEAPAPRPAAAAASGV
jgi:para-aminobenzoate synthetase